MAKKKNEPKSSKSSKLSQKNIGSSSLLPARPHGEKLDMVFSVKSEPTEEQMEVDCNSQEISNLFQVISDAKNKSGIFENGESSNQSTCTEPMDTTTEAQPQSPSVPTCFSNVQVKEEKGSSEKSADQAEYFTEGRMAEANIRAISPLNFEEPNITSTASYIKSEEKERPKSNEEQLENKNEKILSKRKTTFDLELEVLKKKLKKETVEDKANINFINCNPIDQTSKTNDQSEKNVSCEKESVQDAVKEEVIDHEISVLVLPQKNIETIVLSDDESDQNSDDDEIMKSESANTSSKKYVKERNFSTEILSYFNVVSEIDRYDCNTCLESLQQKNINSNLQIYFPIIKKERNIEKAIKRGDVVFSKVALIQSDTTRIPVIQNDNIILHSSAESKLKSFPGLIPLSNINRTSQNVDDISDPLLQSSVTVPQTVQNMFSHNLLLAANSSNLDVNNMPHSLNEQSNSLTSQSISSISTSELEDILKMVQADTANDHHYTRNISQTTDSRTIQSISSITLDLLNSLPRDMFSDPSTNEATSDYHLTRNSNQDSITNIYPQSQAMSPMHNHAFQSTSCAQNTTLFAAALSSSPVPSTSYPSGVPYVLPRSDIENSVQDRNLGVLQHLAYKMISTSDHLPTVNSSQVIDSTAMFKFPSQSMAPLPKHTFETPSQVLDKTSFATTISSFPVSSAYDSGVTCTLPNSNSESRFQNKNTVVIEHPSYKKESTNDRHYTKNSNQVTNCTKMSQISPDHALCTTSPVQDTPFAATIASSSYLPRVPPAYPSCSQDNNNPRNVIKKNTYPSNSQTESSFQNRNTAVGQSPNFPSGGALKHKSTENRDPRITARKAPQFPPRMGEKDKLLYLNIGVDNIDKHFVTLVLQWNPIWLEIQKQTNTEPPIAVYYKRASHFYINELDYYKTYVPMHMLQLWYHIFQSWQVNRSTNVHKYKIIKLENFDNGYKIICFAVINTETLPKTGDIALCEYQKEKAFLHFEDVKMKVSENKVRVTLRSLHNFTHLKENDDISLCILYNINIAQLQAGSLTLIEPSIKPLVLKPSRHFNKIEVVKLNPDKKIKEQREDILIHIKSPESLVVLVEINFNHDNALLLTQLTFNTLLHFNTDFKYNIKSREKQTNQEKTKEKEKDYKILILLKNDNLLEDLCKRLAQYKPILAVRSQQVKLSAQNTNYTLESYLEKIPNADRLQKKDLMNKLIKNHHIFLSTFSSFGAAEKNCLFRIKDLIVIMDDVHLCTEPETAWPLTMKLTKLILMGNSEISPKMPSNLLVSLGFHLTFFLRLLKGKNLC